MPFSHHSHSGQFCNHATNSLEQVVQQAIKMGMSTFAMTEHIPRGDEDLYPGEETHEHYIAGLEKTFDDYYQEAIRLRTKYGSRIKLLIGFETEWIRPESLGIVEGLLQKYRFDLFIGSVHHVHTIPIDYDDATYRASREKSGGTDEKLAEDFFDAQYEMLKALKPPVIGHFDLIRLKSDDNTSKWTGMSAVWSKILRNLEFISSYGGILEINTSGLRKGMDEPYPKAEICHAFMNLKGRFTLSDDSHGVDQVGTNYNKAFKFMDRIGLPEIWYLEKSPDPSNQRLDATIARAVPMADLQEHQFWQQND